MRLPLTLSALAIAATLAGCGQKASTEAASDSAAAPAAAEPTDAEKAAILAALPAPYNTADLENGRRKFGLCRSCHSIEKDGPNMTGPHLYGVIGRQAGSLSDYNYSEDLKKAGFAWDVEKLHAWLTDTHALVPGTKMPPVVGLKQDKDRNDVIAYVMVESGYKPQ